MIEKTRIEKLWIETRFDDILLLKQIYLKKNLFHLKIVEI